MLRWYQRVSGSVRLVIFDVFKGTAKSAFVLWLFYRSPVIVFACSLPYGIWNRKREVSRRVRKQKERMAMEFREVMLDMASSLSAGYSVENAWREATRNIENLYEKESVLLNGMRKVCTQIECNCPLEYALTEFAERCGVEDMIHFAEVFQTAKRMGGNLIEVTRNTARNISERMEVKREIGSMLAGKRMEGRVMSVIPLAMILYFWICSPDFLDCLYTVSGHAVMTAFLAIYLAAYSWSERIGDIAV